MIAKIVTRASFGGCTAYAYGKDQAEVISHDVIIPDDPKIAAKCFEIQSHKAFPSPETARPSKAPPWTEVSASPRLTKSSPAV